MLQWRGSTLERELDAAESSFRQRVTGTSGGGQLLDRELDATVEGVNF